MEFITIKESHYATDLFILKSKLESEGVECYLKDEYMSQILSHIPSMLVKLQVHTSDIEKVKKIMIENGDLPQE